jgi:hypothetical protein
MEANTVVFEDIHAAAARLTARRFRARAEASRRSRGVAAGSLWAIALVVPPPVGNQCRRDRAGEALPERKFGDAYLAYKGRVQI